MEYDVIIVGAGSAGCVLANRLSASPSTRVLLIEAGPRDWNPMIHMPAGISHLVRNTSINWNYTTEPQPALQGRRLWWPRGKVLGGSSAINAMCYVRGVPADYDDWARANGDPRWAWEAVLPRFLRHEDNNRGSSELHATGGPLGVSDLRHRNPLSQTMIDAAAAAGFRRNDDFNGAHQEGFGFYQVTQRNGARCSAASAFLAPVRARANLRVMTGSLVERVLLDGQRACGVQLRGRGKPVHVHAGQVVLAGGTLNSPHLLMLSGIGPADHLREHGIDVVHDAAQVGANLQDHLDICTLVGSRLPVTYDKINEVAVALRFMLHRDGIGTSNVAEAGGFARSRYATDERCDLQFHFVPAMLDDHGRHRLKGYGYTLHACALRPHSRGHLRLRSADPAQGIGIDPGYLGDAEGFDLKMMIEAAKLSRDILAQTPFDTYRDKPIFPTHTLRDDADFEAFIRAKAETIYHPVGSCRMGGDAHSVVDSELRVRGVEGLRVVDASVMPTLPGGNTNAPTMMIAEHASELMLR
jgi:choline dehydrogenase